MMHAGDFGAMFSKGHAVAFSAAQSNDTIVMKEAARSTPTDTSPVTAESTDSPESASDDAIPTVFAGMSATEVRAVLGEPESISDDGARWTYGSNILIFKDGRLTGQVSFDPVAAAQNKYNNLMDLLETIPGAAKSASKSTGAKLMHAKIKTPLSNDRYRYKAVLAGSSRDAYRSDREGNEYSYYMNRSGPLDRVFMQKPSLPRGMSTVNDRYLNRAYQSYGTNSRFGTTSNYGYRR